jgi:hypothetical protein
MDREVHIFEELRLLPSQFCVPKIQFFIIFRPKLMTKKKENGPKCHFLAIFQQKLEFLSRLWRKKFASASGNFASASDDFAFASDDFASTSPYLDHLLN